MKILYTFFISFFFISCHSQDMAIYRLFDKELDKTILTLNISNKKEIQIQGQKKDIKEMINFTESLYNTTQKNIYYFKTDQFKDKKSKGFGIIEFIENDKAVGYYLDTIFTSKEQIEKYISIPENLEMATAFYFVKDIQLEQAKAMPSIRNITIENLKKLKERNAERIKRTKILSEKLDLVKQFKLFAKYNMWLNMECLLLGYKFPQDKDEHKWLTNTLKN